mmetsp:Transcript_4333/g.13225  ORF Transcript_4333/g.13225 Transcript_4333/m.13225 type:complete len:297 (-) Transcript_4333:77-967(-)
MRAHTPLHHQGIRLRLCLCLCLCVQCGAERLGTKHLETIVVLVLRLERNLLQRATAMSEYALPTCAQVIERRTVVVSGLVKAAVQGRPRGAVVAQRRLCAVSARWWSSMRRRLLLLLLTVVSRRFALAAAAAAAAVLVICPEAVRCGGGVQILERVTSLHPGLVVAHHVLVCKLAERLHLAKQTLAVASGEILVAELDLLHRVVAVIEFVAHLVHGTEAALADGLQLLKIGLVAHEGPNVMETELTPAALLHRASLSIGDAQTITMTAPSCWNTHGQSNNRANRSDEQTERQLKRL